MDTDVRERVRRTVARLVAACVLVLIGTACGQARASGENGSADFVRLVGRGPDGATIRIVWGPDGGDVETTYAEGVQERTWFRGDRLLRRRVSGDVYALPTSEAQIAQARRIVFTSGFRKLAPVKTEEGSGMRLVVYPGPGAIRISLRSAIGGPVSVASVGDDIIAGLRYDGDYAVAWKSFRGAFEGAKDPAAATFPSPPKSAWDRSGLPESHVDAAAGGLKARVLVDTGARGLLISRAFADRLHAKLLSSGPRVPSFPGSGSFVELPELVLAGKRVAPAIAQLTDDSRYDVFAGIGLFPNTNILFDRNGDARLVRRTCRDGYPIAVDEGVVILHGPDAGAAKLTTMLDTAHRGSPIVDEVIATRSPLGPVQAVPASATGAQCTLQRRTLTFGGRRFGTDVLCYGRTPFTAAFRAGTTPNLLLGLDTLSAKQILVDQHDSTICWLT